MALKFHQDMEKYLALRKRQQFLKNMSSAAWSRVAHASHNIGNSFSHYAGALKNTFRKKHLMVSGTSPPADEHRPTLEKVIEEKVIEEKAKDITAAAGSPQAAHQSENKSDEKPAAKPQKKTFGSMVKALSGFISISTVAEIEEEKNKIQEEQAVKDYFDVQEMMGGQPSGAVMSNVPAASDEGHAVENVSQLFPKSVSAKTANAREEGDEVIELDKGYKIRVIQNR
ncbi:hypothetical protein HYU14_03820 [Candidatus Woesearchaeota archaeon]|nr:hypothetical protein [Candidatus Woesearchaeota archaeon]